MVDSKGTIRRDRRCARCSETRTAGRTGIVVAGEFLELGTFKQPSGKLISAWAIERDFDPVELRSNTCSVEWPPKSGRTVDVPEVDRAAWFSITEAVNKITKGQLPIMQALAKKLSVCIPGPSEKLTSGKSQARRYRKSRTSP